LVAAWFKKTGCRVGGRSKEREVQPRSWTSKLKQNNYAIKREERVELTQTPIRKKSTLNKNPRGRKGDPQSEKRNRP